jgi:protein phosphatase
MSKSLCKNYTRTNKRDNNEDACLSFTLTPKMEDGRECVKVLLLSDGMGGHDHGEVISNKVIAAMAINITKDILLKSITPDLYGTQKAVKDIDFKNLLYEAIIMANHSILQLIESNKWRRTGATLVAVVIYQNKYFWGYLGDSRLYQWHTSVQELSQVSYDHNVPGVLVNEGVLKPEVARFHAQRNQLVYYVGVEKVPNLEKVKFIGEGVLEDNDVLFLCSDGVSSDLEHETITDWFINRTWSSEEDVEEWSENLLDEVTENGESDNQTIVFYEHKTEVVRTPEIIVDDENSDSTEIVEDEDAVQNIEEKVNEAEKLVEVISKKLDEITADNSKPDKQEEEVIDEKVEVINSRETEDNTGATEKKKAG